MTNDTQDRTDSDQRIPDTLTVLTLIMKDGNTHQIPLGENWSEENIRECAAGMMDVLFPRFRLFHWFKDLFYNPPVRVTKFTTGGTGHASAHCAYFNRWRVIGFRLDTMVQFNPSAMLQSIFSQQQRGSSNESLDRLSDVQQEYLKEIKRANDLRERELGAGEEWRGDDDEEQED